MKYIVHYRETYKSKKSDTKTWATKTEVDSDADEQDDEVARVVTSQTPEKKSKTDSPRSGQPSKESNTKLQKGSKGSQDSNNKDPKSNKCFRCDGIGHQI